MNSIVRVFVSLSLVLLVSCASQPKIAVNPQALKQCQSMCVQRFDACQKECANNCRRCSAASTHSSTINFLKYLHEKRVEGGYVTRGLKSYRDPLQCRKVTCNCNYDLMTCKQGCTGIVQKGLRSVPYCT